MTKPKAQSPKPWMAPEMRENKGRSGLDDLVNEIINQYDIRHRGEFQCKCIEGARGHLLAKIKCLVLDEKARSHRNGYNECRAEMQNWLG